jgi:hypothetical protein
LLRSSALIIIVGWMTLQPKSAARYQNQSQLFQHLASLYGRMAELDYGNMKNWQKFVFVPFADLCVITSSNCTKVREMLQRWRERVKE